MQETNPTRASGATSAEAGPAPGLTPRTTAILALILASIAGLTTLGLDRARAEERETAPALALFFMGDRLGQIEPCGCIRNKLGGVQFEATLYDTMPRESSLRLDVGGFSPKINHPEDSMRTRYALQAMTTGLDLDAINVAARDLSMGATWFQDLIENFPLVQERLVSANIYMGEGEDIPVFQPHRVVDRAMSDGSPLRVLITGVTAPQGPSPAASSAQSAGGLPWRVGDPLSGLDRVLNDPPDHDLVVVLVHGNAKTAEAIAATYPSIDVVLHDSPAASASRRAKSESAGAPVVTVQGSEGKLLGKALANRGIEAGWSFSDVEWLEVSPQLKPSPVLAELIESYKRNTEELIILKPRGTERVFAGARACGQCHVAEYEDWKRTRHAWALETLTERGMQYDSRCLECHTVGFARDNGFYNVRESMAMAGVQCESCHGAAQEHVNLEYYLKERERFAEKPPEYAEKQRRAAAVMPSARVDASTCLKCHTPENDDHFVFEEKVRRVNHRGGSG